jgi:hypothetical protein
MNFKILGILLLVFSIGMIANAYAHTMEVEGDYKIEVGWENEPPIVGHDNAITLEVSIATDYDRAQAEAMDKAMEGMDMSGMDMTGMDMSNQQPDVYDTKIGPILGQFETGKMTASMAINQISNIITTENLNDEFGNEIKFLIDDVRSGSITADDAIYVIIKKIGYDTQASAGMDMTGMESGTAEQEHQMALDLEKQGKFADAAEHHHMAALDLEKTGNYVAAAEHHHLAATDLEKAGDYAGAAEHHNLAADDLDKVGKHTEAVDHQHMATKDLAMVGTSTQHAMNTESVDFGLLDNFKVDVMLGKTNTPLKLIEDTKFPGIYHADFTPSIEGFPMVHIAGTLAGEDVDITFHPEAVEGISALPPLKQIKEGVSPDNVECKSGYVLLLKTVSNSPACVSPNSSAKLIEIGWGTKA